MAGHRISVDFLPGLFMGLLADAYSDAVELERHGAAWCRRLMLHLDLMLAVYGATEGSAHWY